MVFRPTTTGTKRRNWRRTQRGRPPCLEPDSRQFRAETASDVRQETTTFRPSESAQRTNSPPRDSGVINPQPQQISNADESPSNILIPPALTQSRRASSRVGLTPAARGGTLASASTSLGEASARI